MIFFFVGELVRRAPSFSFLLSLLYFLAPNPRRQKSSLSSFSLPLYLAYVPAAPAARSAPPGACVPLCCRLLVCLARCRFFFVGVVGFIDLRDPRFSHKRLLCRSRHGDQGHRRRAPRRGEERELHWGNGRERMALKSTRTERGSKKGKPKKKKNHLAKLEKPSKTRTPRPPQEGGARAALPFVLFPPSSLSLSLALCQPFSLIHPKKNNPISKSSGPQRVGLQARHRHQGTPRGPVAQAADRRRRARRGLHQRRHHPLGPADQVSDRRQVRRRDRAADRGKDEWGDGRE